MIALVFEAYGALCLFALVVFLAWAAVAKLRPDLDEEEFDLAKLEKLKSPEWSGDALSIEPPIIEEPSWSPTARPVKPSQRPIRRRPHLFPRPEPSDDLALRFEPKGAVQGELVTRAWVCCTAGSF